MLVLRLTVLAAAAMSAYAVLLRTDAMLAADFRAFVIHYNKSYVHDDDEYESRFATYRENVAKIDALNARKTGATFAINKFADHTVEEFKASFVKYSRPAERPYDYVDLTSVEAVDSIDWRAKGAVTPVKDQQVEKCGACYTFAATGAVEGAWAIKTGNLTELSQSELLDCTGSFGNMGCHGGKTYYAYDYIKAKGICTEEAYPYVPEAEDCRASALPKSGVNISAYKDVPQGDEAALQKTLALGVVSIAVYCDSWYMFYKSGVYNDTCSSDPGAAVAVWAIHTIGRSRPICASRARAARL
jgi:KDEL-tailed cysteine endopeptidase